MIISNGFVLKDQFGDTVLSMSYEDDGCIITTTAGGESEDFFFTSQGIEELVQAIAALLKP